MSKKVLFIGLDGAALRDNVLEESAEPGNVPLPVAEIEVEDAGADPEQDS